MNTSLKLILGGLAAFGLYKAYEAAPVKFNIGSQFQGQRSSIQEAMLWEQAGMPSSTRMMPRRRY
jgi:hypothetical protein